MGSIVDLIGSFDSGATDPEFYKPDMLTQNQVNIDQLLANSLGGSLRFLSADKMNKLNRQLFQDYRDPNQGRSNRALAEALTGKVNFSRNADLYKRGLLQPAMREFDRTVKPQIESSFASHGATFSTRRGQAVKEGLADVQAQAMESLSRYNAQAIQAAEQRKFDAIGIPMQQQQMRLNQVLGRIGGLAQLSAAKNQSYYPALNYIGQRQRELVSTETGKGAASYSAGGQIIDDFMQGGFSGVAGTGTATGCCFIMLEARYGNGTMDRVVRRFRDEHMTSQNRRGYYKLAEVLVPLMRKSRIVKFLVRAAMTTPLVIYGKAHYREGSRLGLLLAPVKNFWMSLFDYLGKDHPFIRENGEVI